MTELIGPGTVAQIHFSSEGVDGVSLQIQETRLQLDETELENATISCDFDPQSDFAGVRIPELNYHDPRVARLREQLNPAWAEAAGQTPTLVNPKLESELLDKIYAQAYSIEQKLEQAIDRLEVTVVHLRNITSLPHLHPGAALAAYRLIKRRQDVHFLLHHHDLSWEGPAAKFNYFTFPKAEELMQQIQVPNFPNTSHIAINPRTRDRLAEKFGIKIEYIPDGFDFNQEVAPLKRDEFIKLINAQYLEQNPESHPLNKNDLIFGMMTRIVSNKSIELAIQLIAQIEKNRSWLHQQKIGPHQIEFSPESQIVLVMPNPADAQLDYQEKLTHYAKQKGVKIVFVKNLEESGVEFYQTYQPMDAIIYPSEHEGFGNQAIEAVWSRLLMIVHYYPVFTALIDSIPHHVSLGYNSHLVRGELTNGLNLLNPEILEQATFETILSLLDPNFESKLDQNRELLEKLCSIEVVVNRYMEIYFDESKHRPARRAAN
ncbi:MAG: glycosyltransferase [Candidatus Pacebacteria bacterium]|nr:glycosyltransferase [Candidatus Paceibacterota bacterium]